MAELDCHVDCISELADLNNPLPENVVDLLLHTIDALASSTRRIDDGTPLACVLETMVRALAVTDVQMDGRVLVNVFEKTWDEGLKWAIVNTVACVNPHSIDRWVATLLEDDYWGEQLRNLGYGGTKKSP